MERLFELNLTRTFFHAHFLAPKADRASTHCICACQSYTVHGYNVKPGLENG